jgi:hypothetical protein
VLASIALGKRWFMALHCAASVSGIVLELLDSVRCQQRKHLAFG